LQKKYAASCAAYSGFFAGTNLMPLCQPDLQLPFLPFAQLSVVQCRFRLFFERVSSSFIEKRTEKTTGGSSTSMGNNPTVPKKEVEEWKRRYGSTQEHFS